ncbi:Phosphoribosylformylglycinamidine synthase [Nymphon striatum]|nr:Phosphoribosylformylglycinamidine synthase [Nymphon striatum]
MQKLLRELRVEMIDRFGLVPDPVKNLFEATRLKQIAQELGIIKLDMGEEGGRILFNEKPNIDPIKIMQLVQKRPWEFTIKGQDKLYFEYEPMMELDQRVQWVKRLFNDIKNGDRAFSDFNKNKLLKSLQNSIPELIDIHARYWHFVKVSETLNDEENETLKELLHYGEQDDDEKPLGELFLVTPRPGTISPWSSKATDILHNCGMDKVERVERGIAYFVEYKNDFTNLSEDQRLFVTNRIHDRMIEVVMEDEQDAIVLFNDAEPAPLKTIALGEDALAAISQANVDLGLALSEDEIQYLADNYAELDRDPTDVELMMFAQANSEHCRHKIFNADWIIDGKKQDQTLFGMIKNTYKQSPEEPVHMLMKVETHNHPTAISPFPGAATGSGGEIRDEGATGNGSKPKAGLCGFSVSNLKIPDYPMPWEIDHGKPSRIDSALDIMLEGPNWRRCI